MGWLDSTATQTTFSGGYGRVSASHMFHVKVRWAMGVMLVLIVVLVGAVIFLAREVDDANALAEAASKAAPAPAPAPIIPKARILVPVRDLREGDKLSRDSFKEISIPQELAPSSILTTDDILSIEGRYAREDLSAGAFVEQRAISLERPITAFYIPAGYRAVTVMADKQTSVEGFVKPGSNVDVLWVYTDEGKSAKQIATIVRYARVLSVAGDTHTDDERARIAGAEKTFTVTILASEKDAKIIQLAAASGQITLSLVGDSEQLKDSGAENEAAADILSIGDVLKKSHKVERPKVTSKDPVTGKLQSYLFHDGDWELSEDAAQH